MSHPDYDHVSQHLICARTGRGGWGHALTSGLLLCFAVMLLNSCVTYIPVDEYNIARTSYEAARDADAARYAPALWFNTEQAYREAQQLYKERNYKAAQSRFQQARVYGEQAENAARLARHQSGDAAP